jgi:hypothetical protein
LRIVNTTIILSFRPPQGKYKLFSLSRASAWFRFFTFVCIVFACRFLLSLRLAKSPLPLSFALHDAGATARSNGQSGRRL